MTREVNRPLIGRRTAFQGLAALGVAVVLAGCGKGADSGPKATAGEELATTSEIPVGGGLVLADQRIVVTQPTEGTFEAFSATCTHQGQLLSAVDDQGIHCPRHGSIFDIADGSAVQGPATAALPSIAITVKGDKILAA